MVSVSGETRECPVCDAPIDPGIRRCPECSTDLTLFDVNRDGVPDLDPAAAAPGKSIDDILASIEGKDVRSDIFEDIKTIGTTVRVEGVEPEAEFQCPTCDAPVTANAQRCPSCGAVFAQETVEQFECPLCNAVVAVDATSCPSCGVQFAQEVATPSSPVGPVEGATAGRGARGPCREDQLR